MVVRPFDPAVPCMSTSTTVYSPRHAVVVVPGGEVCREDQVPARRDADRSTGWRADRRHLEAGVGLLGPDHLAGDLVGLAAPSLSIPELR
jgi:hypothetical protein